ncbi:protein RFT1 homolog [Dendronephthya gigantea]|uniref:protein RFT1 homolog n=1 Tax=Dendronephthya gigantea TaxID=151771 RepID=UPI00106BB66B|nr:protein RFT1 homolog [Dendronephthya gigantea]
MATSSDVVLQSAMKSASYNVILQISLRIITFLMNAFILRFISRETLGLVNVRLTLLYTTILFLAREAFRKTCLSHSSESKGTKWDQIINMIWLAVPLGASASLVFGFIWLNWLEMPPMELAKDYLTSVVCFASSAILELMAEPLWIVFQCHLFVRLKVVIEGSAVLLRCITAASLVYFVPSLGLLAFCFAQLMQSLTYFLLYYIYFFHFIKANTKKNDKEFPLRAFNDVFPSRKSPNSLWINFKLLSLTWSFFKQSLLKQILTEGERYVMTLFNALTLAQQGVYDVINNLGSLAARFIFLPVEESYYLFFTQTLVRDKPASKQQPESLCLAAETLESVLKFVLLIGLTIVVFGYSYSLLALDIYGGSILSSGEGPTQLRWHCFYILIIAVNGITECFMFATMSQEAVEKYNKKMVVFSVIFLLSSWFLTYFGAVGFIFANCLNMMLRIIHSLIYIQEYFCDTSLRPLQGFLPSKPVLLAYIIACIFTLWSDSMFCCSYGWFWRLCHIATGGLCGLAVILTIYLTEENLVQFVKKQLFSKLHTKVE